MKYTDSKGNIINDINDWENIVFQSSKKRKHWKVGRSAYELANFMMNSNGEATIRKIVSDLIVEDVSFESATPELEIRFDTFGHGREHDLGIWGITESKKTIFIGVESKVDELFSGKISDSFIIAKTKELNGVKTNIPKRIESLLKRNFKVLKTEYFDLRYQLLYSTVGTLDAIDNKATADISILLIIVFKTDLYDEIKGIENYKDYIKFVNCLDSKRIESSFDIDMHKLRIDDKVMYSIYKTIEKN